MKPRPDALRRSVDPSQELYRERTKAQPCDGSCPPPTRGKKTHLQRLKEALIPYLKSSRRLAQSYAEAAAQKERNEAQMVAEQADEIAARKDFIRQKEVKEFSSSIDNIFAVDGLPPGAKVLKLAKLLENNPQLEAHAEAAKRILEQLSSDEIVKGPDKSLLPPRREA